MAVSGLSYNNSGNHFTHFTVNISPYAGHVGAVLMPTSQKKNLLDRMMFKAELRWFKPKYLPLV